LNEFRGEIEKNLKFNGQLGAKLMKSKTMDQNEKGIKIWGWTWSLLGAEMHKIKNLKPIMDVIERNQKLKDHIELY